MKIFFSITGIVFLLTGALFFSACKNPASSSKNSAKLYNISIANSPSAGGSFTVKVDGVPQTAPIQAPAGAIIILDATDKNNTYYAFKDFTVSPAISDFSGTTASAAFYMPSNDITVTAQWRVDVPPQARIITPPAGNPMYTLTVDPGAMPDTFVSFYIVIADEDWELASVTVTGDASGDEVFFAETLPPNGKFTFLMPSENVTITVNVIKMFFNIDVTEYEDGSIVIESGAAGGKAKAGETITLSLWPDYLFIVNSVYFNGEDADHGDGNEWTFTMPEEDVTITAVFEYDTSVGTLYDLTVTQTAGGVITFTINDIPINKDTLKAAEGAVIVLTATADEDQYYEFVKFIVSGATLVDDTLETVSFAMPANAVTVEAEFFYNPPKYDITVEGTGNGAVTFTVDGTAIAGNTARAEEGAIIVLTADPDSSYLFNKFLIDPELEDLTETGANEWTFAMPAEDITVTPVFVQEPVLVSPQPGTSFNLTATVTNAAQETNLGLPQRTRIIAIADYIDAKGADLTYSAQVDSGPVSAGTDADTLTVTGNDNGTATVILSAVIGGTAYTPVTFTFTIGTTNFPESFTTTGSSGWGVMSGDNGNMAVVGNTVESRETNAGYSAGIPAANAVTIWSFELNPAYYTTSTNTGEQPYPYTMRLAAAANDNNSQHYYSIRQYGDRFIFGMGEGGNIPNPYEFAQTPTGANTAYSYQANTWNRFDIIFDRSGNTTNIKVFINDHQLMFEARSVQPGITYLNGTITDTDAGRSGYLGPWIGFKTWTQPRSVSLRRIQVN